MPTAVRYAAAPCAALILALTGCAEEPQTTPAEITAGIRAYAAEQCGPNTPDAGYEPGYLRVVDISKDRTPDYAVDYAAIRCGGDRPLLCGDAGCPRRIWVSDGRGDYVMALDVQARAFEVDAEAVPPRVTVTLVGDNCPAPPPTVDGVTAEERPAAPGEIVCRKAYVFDPIQLRFLDADRAGAQTAPAGPATP